MTPRPTRRQKEHRRDSLLTPRPTRRQKEHRRDRNKANQLKMTVFFGTKAHKKTERAQKRQKQSKST